MSERICAVVVSYNRRPLLGDCLRALQAQTRPVDAILVVDNASTDDTRAMLRAEFPDVPVLALTTNSGGAGGFHAGMKWAYGENFDWIWVMDDDGRPAPDCLERLLARGRPNVILEPYQQEDDGRIYGFYVWRNNYIDVTIDIMAQRPPTDGFPLFTFVGPLIHRDVVTNAGLPNKDFFICFDDFEYAFRVTHHTDATIVFVPEAQFFHDFGRKSQPQEVRSFGRRSVRSPRPAWRLYYDPRNELYTLLRIGRGRDDLAAYFKRQARYLLGELVYETDGRERARLRVLGMLDGAIGRLGKRV